VFPLTTEHRDIQILHGYNIVTDDWRTHFVLPERQGRTSFQRVVLNDLSAPIASGKYHVDGQTESDAGAHAVSMIDSYLDDE